MTKKQLIALYTSSAVLAAVVFIGLYGIDVLNPVYTDWLMTGGDLTQHYLGWKAFRFAAWQFPFGLIDNLSYPNCSSVIFTDSIPLLSVICKILSPILPHTFQFFGLYGLMGFILSGVLSADILRRYSSDVIPVLLCSVFFVIAPVMLFRMFLHTALASQWIILLGLRCIFLYEERFEDHSSRSILLFAVLGLLSGSIHIYYVIFSGFILIAFCIMDGILSKRLRTGILCGITFLAVFFLTVWLLGGVSYRVSPASDGLGLYSMNLNSFYNPMGWSSFLHDFPVLNAVQEEECLGYLGLGVLALAVPAVLFRIINRADTKGFPSVQRTVLLVLFSVMVLFALSPVISFNDHIVFQYKLPYLLTKVWSVFRATGRFCWLPVYLLMFAVFIPLLQNRRWSFWLIAGGLILQTADLSGALFRIHSEYAEIPEYRSLLETKVFWDAVSEQTPVKHIVFTESISKDTLYSFTDYAIDHDMTVSNYYFARSTTGAAEETAQNALASLSEENLYLFSDPAAAGQYPLLQYMADGFLVGLTKPIPGMEAYRMR